VNATILKLDAISNELSSFYGICRL